jgi:hypothetical protein
MKKLLVMLLFGAAAFGQATGPTLTALFPNAPSGPCPPRNLAINSSTGQLFNCFQGNWFLVSGGGGGGGGTVLDFSAGNLPPLFTTSVASSTLHPALSFTFQAAPANTMLGNNTSLAAAPTWIPIPTGGGGGGAATSLQWPGGSPISLAAPAPTTAGQVLGFDGTNIVAVADGSLSNCSTPTAGNLQCDNSVAVTTGSEGVLSLAFSALPTPPENGNAQLAPDASGMPFWSPGQGLPFVPILRSVDIPPIGGVTLVQ